jgi:GntR family transcriptional regulator/MocR family aminotransferase
MKPFIPDFNNSSASSLYIQLYRHIKKEIVKGRIRSGEKLPSLRQMAKDSGVSVTTVGQAYDQLLIEGYVFSKPQSGYYVSDIPGMPERLIEGALDDFDLSTYSFDEAPYMYDLDSFDFQKWKKCMAKVINDYPELLLSESDIQGEAALRFEIAKYLYSSRGVNAHPNQVVIGAGSQQLTAHLCRILRRMSIGHVCTEDPGYTPISKIFQDNGFNIVKIPITKDGIRIDKLPVNIRSAVYVSPQNQFPTGAVMPIANRYRLLHWVNENESVILEDDYDSELRYFGKTIPALQGLDKNGRVVYFGSFTATLFPAIKISYMILPEQMAEIFYTIMSDYRQTCSKAEQLTLALFMENGYYYTNIRNIRSLYAQKLKLTTEILEKYAKGFIETSKAKSGKNMFIRVKSALSCQSLCDRAKEVGIRMTPLDGGPADREKEGKIKDLIFFYNQIPLEKIEMSLKALIKRWKE